MSNTDIWLNSNYISKWDSDPISGNPVRGEQVDLLLSLVADHYISGSTILDIGSGSGLVEEQLFRRLPAALVVGIDYSPALMAMAEKRLADKEKQFVTVRHDLCNIDNAKLPERNYQVAISVQTIHNLPCQTQRNVMSWVYKVLSTPGFFFFLDRVAVPQAQLFSCYESVWKKQNSAYSASIDEGRSFADHQRYLKQEGDSPMTLQENLKVLGESGFLASALDVRGNRALIACVKAE
jgi:ubiquinone/menaquinone biosynthesis C-methylase UbiE